MIERLISGCASARAAVRLGYTTALGTILMTKAGESWELDKILAVADKKMDLAEKVGIVSSFICTKCFDSDCWYRTCNWTLSYSCHILSNQKTQRSRSYKNC